MVVVVAWAVVVWVHATTPDHHRHESVDVPAGLSALPLWGLMCVAMMVPSAWPAVRHVAINSLRWRRQRAIAEFLAAYLAVWGAFGVVVLSGLAFAGGLSGTVVLAMAFGVAACWQILPYQRRFQRDCHRTVPLPPRGRLATAGCARFGVRHGRACVGVCWPLMLVMAVVMHQTALWMVVLTALVSAVKLVPRSKRLSGPIALGLGTFAVIFLIL
ncbi:MAG: DUF2182 domain-containing protein [Pseudonocardia sp.]